MKPYLAECIGTALLILFGNGVVANALLGKSKGYNAGWLAITAGWALAASLAVFTTARVSGAHLNPAVTLALASTGAFSWSLVPGYLVAQIVGGMLGSTLVFLIYSAHWAETTDQGAILACHCTAPAIRRNGPAFMTEFIATAIFIFVVLAIGKVATGAPPGSDVYALAAATWFGPILIGTLVFAVGLSLGGPTGYAINPARDFGPRLAHALLPIPHKGGSDWSYAWVPIVAPILGGIVGAKLFVALGL